MKHEPISFGRRRASAGWQLRARLDRRRSARRAALGFAAFATLLGAASAALGELEQPGGSVLLGIFAFGALMIATAAATEA